MTHTLKYHINHPAIIFVMLLGFCCMCYKSDGQVREGSLTDRDGNLYNTKSLPAGKTWMTVNLNTNIPGSYCYDSAAQYCQQYGHLYTWQAAQQGCKLLGAGWRLPSRSEWQQLVFFFGDSTGDINALRKTAYKNLLRGGITGFNALLGGGREPAENKYARLEAHGFYWTITSMDTGTAWYYNFAKGSQSLYEQDGGEKLRAFSVRCIHDTTVLKQH